MLSSEIESVYHAPDPIQALSRTPQALDAAGISWAEGGLEKLDRMRCGILLGSAMGGMKTFATAIETLHTQVTSKP